MKTYRTILLEGKGNWNSHTANDFYHYGSGRGIAGLWGSTDPKKYAHMGGKPKIFSFMGGKAQVSVDATHFDPVVSESLYHSLVTPEYEKDYEHFEELDMTDLFMDLVVAIRVKEKKRAGIIYEIGGDWKKQIAQYLVNHSLSELKKNYKKVYDGKISY
jgi:hypothetical protein